MKAYNSNENLKNDSLKGRNLLKIAFEAYRQKNYTFFKKVNKEALSLSLKTKDTFGIADTHWNCGNFFSRKEVNDSAYYHYSEANKLYEVIGDKYYSAKMLYNMSIIQANTKDYTGSEKLMVKAISKFKPLERNLNLYRSYNHLGVIYKELEEYERSVFYHNQALSFLKKIKDKKIKNNRFYKEGSYNNLSLVYQKWGNHDEAIFYLKEALENTKVRIENPKLYARLIDNLAYNKLQKGDVANLSKAFFNALSIRDSLDDTSGIIINKLHLAEYYLKLEDTSQAISFASDANKLAKNANRNRDHLVALKLLSKIDTLNSKKYLNNYITLGDSLQRNERKIREKFTRILFETDEFQEETKRSEQQKKIAFALSIVSVFAISLLYFVKRQHSKNKQLIFESEQQKSNEEIYRLMLKQQSNLEEGRLLERNRISEELHDGVLGRLFGTRLGIGFLDLEGDAEALEKHEKYIDELQSIEKEIRTISHELKNEILSSKLSYVDLIENLLEKQNVKGEYKHTLTFNDDIYWDEVDEKIKINIYRIIQEALQNINKYSKAKNVSIDFDIRDNILNLTMADDGIGFNVKKAAKGIGLLNISSRAKKLGAELIISSTKNQGTEIIVKTPINSN